MQQLELVSRPVNRHNTTLDNIITGICECTVSSDSSHPFGYCYLPDLFGAWLDCSPDSRLYGGLCVASDDSREIAHSLEVCLCDISSLTRIFNLN